MNNYLNYLNRNSQEYKNTINQISNTISDLLCNSNLKELDFEYNGRYITIKGIHKEVNNHYYGSFIKLNYDLSNKEEAIVNFVDMWKNLDNPEHLVWFKNFIQEGDKYGWD